MSDDRVHRRLAAILAADVVGYTRLMGIDEVGTRARLNAALADVVGPALEAHRGRMFKTIGDGFLVEFGSVVDAVDCAANIQQAMKAREQDASDPLVFRIGVNLGDVIIEGSDVHGDGVNVAARLEALADPGGICISRSARDQIRDKLSYPIEDMGEVEVKNVARPVRAFRLRLEAAEGGASPGPPRGMYRTRLLRRFAAASLAAALALGALIFLAPWSDSVESASSDRMKLPLPDKPSVAVLPFAVASSAPDDRMFAAAVAEDLTRSLARISELFVIASSSTAAFIGDKAVPARVAEELGVRYVVRATMRRSGAKVRIDAELIDALSGRIVWSDRLERANADVFELQDALVRALASRLSGNLGRVKEQARFTRNLDAFFLWAQADRESWINTPESYGKARALARQALKIDPGFARARAVLAFIDAQEAWFRVSKDPEASLEHALAGASAAVASTPNDWYPRMALAQTYLNMGDYARAEVEYAQLLAVEPSDARLLTRSALPLIFLGRGRDAEERLRVAIRLNPFHDWLPNQLLGQALYLQGRYEEAAVALDEARRKNPRFIGNMWWRAATYGQLGQKDEAKQAVADILARMPDAAISRNFIKISDDAALERFLSGLRAAGLPE